MLEVSQPAVSQWEKGLRTPEDEFIPTIAAALDVLPLTLLDQDVAITTPMFRASGITKKKDERKIEGRTELARLAASRILEQVEVEPTLPWPSSDDPLGMESEAAAQTLRRVWRIPPGPISNLTNYVESAGTVVIRADFGHSKVEAAYAHPRRDSTRWIIMNSQSTDGARYRLTLAHEVGHAVLHHWDAFNVPDEAEREAQAYSFALALLVPSDEFILDVAHTQRSWDDFLWLRPKWGVSAAALARRARDLGLLNDRDYRSINITRNSLGHRTSEPGGDERVESPTVFANAVRLLREQAGWVDHDFSVASGLPYSRLSDLLPIDFRSDSPSTGMHLKRVK